jgi:NRPS condensation-like uncharacterized protein
VQDWFSVAIALGHDRTVRLVLDLDGRIDHPRLQRALELVRRGNPIIDCAFVSHLFFAEWKLREDRGSLDLCRLVATGDPAGDLDAFMAVPIDPRRDPLVQIRVFRSEADTLCIKVSHAVMDGGGFKQLVEHLTATYRALGSGAQQPRLAPIPVNRGQRQVLKGIPARERLRTFLTQPFHKKSWSFPYTKAEVGDVRFSLRVADVPITEIRAAARRQSASITDAIVTCFSRAIFATTPAPDGVPLPFTLAIDLRRYLASPDAAGLVNLSSLVWVDLVKKPGSSFEESLVETHGALNAAMDDFPGVGLAMVMQILRVLGYSVFTALNKIRALMARRQAREFPSISNIGTIDAKVLDLGDVRVAHARFYGVVVYPPSFCLVSGSFDDKLYFTASYPASVVPGDLVERVMDRMVIEIRSLCRG